MSQPRLSPYCALKTTWLAAQQVGWGPFRGASPMLGVVTLPTYPARIRRDNHLWRYACSDTIQMRYSALSGVTKATSAYCRFMTGLPPKPVVTGRAR